MKKQPLLSVVIIAYNAADTIQKSINSILEQNTLNPKSDIELVIVDDKSEDNLKGICDMYKNKFVNYVYHILEENNHKLGALRYKGTCLSTGKWITFLDADDQFIPNSLNLFTEQVPTDKNSKLVGIWTHELYKPYSFETDQYFDNYSNGHLHGKFYNMSFLREYNINFLPNMTFEEDLYFNVAFLTYALAHKYLVYEIKAPTYQYEGSPTSICNKLITKSIDSGILYPDHHLIHYDDYVYAAAYVPIEFYKQYKNDVFYSSIMSIIFSFYYSYNYYLFLNTQFTNKDDSYYEYFLKAKHEILKTFNQLPEEFTIEAIEKFAYMYPEKVIECSFALENVYKPGGFVYQPFCIQSLHEFLTEFKNYF